MKDYYKILELPFGASSLDIKRAYYRLAFKYHPDKNFGNPVFESIFKEINEAYLVLSNENKRLIYHAEYNDFKNGIIFRHEPVVPADPAFRPQPRGPATRITFEYKELKITVAILFTLMVLYLLYESIGYMKEPPDAESVLSKYDTSRVTQHLTKDEYYEIISREFMDSHDSTLMKLDVDSMLHVMDSIMNAGKE